jgi:hypothetical protein
VSDILEIKTAIVEIKGELRTMSAEMRSGDRDSSSSVKLLAQTVENLAHNQSEQRQDLKAAMLKFEERTEALRDLANNGASAVRLDLERQIKEHTTADAPHEKTLGVRLDMLERRNAQLTGFMALLSFLGLPGVAAIVTFFGHK